MPDGPELCLAEQQQRWAVTGPSCRTACQCGLSGGDGGSPDPCGTRQGEGYSGRADEEEEAGQREGRGISGTWMGASRRGEAGWSAGDTGLSLQGFTLILDTAAPLSL